MNIYANLVNFEVYLKVPVSLDKMVYIKVLCDNYYDLANKQANNV